MTYLQIINTYVDLHVFQNIGVGRIIIQPKQYFPIFEYFYEYLPFCYLCFVNWISRHFIHDKTTEIKYINRHVLINVNLYKYKLKMHAKVNRHFQSTPTIQFIAEHTFFIINNFEINTKKVWDEIINWKLPHAWDIMS